MIDILERTFDARPSLDPRDAEHPIRPMLGNFGPRSFTWSIYARLNQGREGSCVGHGWAHELAARPKPMPGITHEYAVGLYRDAKQVDEWQGDAYEGTSNNAGAKVVRARGLIQAWRWAQNPLEAMISVGRMGPVVIAVPWLERMANTDSKGFIRAEGQEHGWHCVAIHAVRVVKHDPMQSVLTGVNSWGPEWGDDGLFRLTAADLGKLMDRGGDVCVPLGRR